jgi:hypothetical protein
MSKPVVAKNADLENHIKADPKLVHGIWNMIRTSTALLANLVHKQGSTYDTKPLIQRGTTSMRNATAVVFTIAFKTGCVPTVTANVVANGADQTVAIEPTPTNTGFAGTVKDSGGNLQTSNVNWIAIGEIT